jgi:hypothetical protein
MAKERDKKQDDGVPRQGNGSGWSGNALRYGAETQDWAEGGPEAPYQPGLDISVEDKAETSENHEAELLGIGSLHSALGASKGLPGAATRWAAHRKSLLSFYLPRELARGAEGVGLGGGEGLVPDAHTHQHLAGVMASRAAAVVMKDRELLDDTLELVLRWVRAFRAISTPRGFVCGPGLRTKDKPYWGSATAFLRQYLMLPGPLPHLDLAKGDKDRAERNWVDPFNLPVRILRWLQQSGLDKLPTDPVSIKPAGCNLKLPMIVYRKEGVGHLAVIPKPTGRISAPKSEVCDWCYVPHNVSSMQELTNRVEFGKDWKTPPPAPPRGAIEIVFASRFAPLR